MRCATHIRTCGDGTHSVCCVHVCAVVLSANSWGDGIVKLANMIVVVVVVVVYIVIVFSDSPHAFSCTTHTHTYTQLLFSCVCPVRSWPCWTSLAVFQ